MFNLESAVQQWKEIIAAIDSVSADDVIELESHLRESVTKLSHGELDEHEAFIVATQRLGHPVELNKEFAKVHGATIWRKRILWMLCGYFVYSLSSAWFGAVAAFIAVGMGVTGMSATTIGAVSVIVWAFGWAALLTLAFLKSKSPMGSPDRIPLSWVCVGGVTLVLAVVFNQAGIIIQMKTLELDELGVMYFWKDIGFRGVNACVFVATATLIWMLNEPNSDAIESVA